MVVRVEGGGSEGGGSGVVVVTVVIEEEGDVEVLYITCVSQTLVTSGREVGVVMDGGECGCSGNVEGGDGALGDGCVG